MDQPKHHSSNNKSLPSISLSNRLYDEQQLLNTIEYLEEKMLYEELTDDEEAQLNSCVSLRYQMVMDEYASVCDHP